MKKQIFLFLITLVVGLAAFVFLYQKVGLKDVFSAIQRLKFYQIVIFAIIYLTIEILAIWRWKITLKVLGAENLFFPLIWRARSAEKAVSYLTPIMYTGGEAFRAIILKRDKDIPLTLTLISIVLERIVQVLAGLILAYLSAIIFLVEGYFLTGILILILTAICHFFGWLFFASPKASPAEIIKFFIKIFHLEKIKYGPRQISLGGKFNLISEKAEEILRHPPNEWSSLILISLLTLLCWALGTKLLLTFFSVDIGLGQLLLFRFFVTLGMTIPIPAALGSFEGMNILAFSFFGLTSGIGLAYSLIYRFFDIFVIGIFGSIIAIYYLCLILYEQYLEKT